MYTIQFIIVIIIIILIKIAFFFSSTRNVFFYFLRFLLLLNFDPVFVHSLRARAYTYRRNATRVIWDIWGNFFFLREHALFSNRSLPHRCGLRKNNPQWNVPRKNSRHRCRSTEWFSFQYMRYIIRVKFRMINTPTVK